LVLSIIPLVLAWQRSTNNPGTSKDANFYLLVQSSVLQFPGLFTAMFPIYRRSTASAWRWAQSFTALGVLCSFGCIPLYLKAPTMWSALISFYGSAAQAGMTLLIAQMADSDDIPAAKKKD
jgi:heme A synthase